jgi:hypothetical protein
VGLFTTSGSHASRIRTVGLARKAQVRPVGGLSLRIRECYGLPRGNFQARQQVFRLASR